MNVTLKSLIVVLLAYAGLANVAFGQSSDSPDGLVKVTPRRMELAWLRPGTDFRPYTKVMVDPTQVAFQPQWFKDYNLSASLGNLKGESLQPLPFSECLLRKLEALSRCSIEMCKPIEIGSYQ